MKSTTSLLFTALCSGMCLLPATGNPQLVVTAVPEPGPVALATLTIGGLLLFRRQKMRR